MNEMQEVCKLVLLIFVDWLEVVLYLVVMFIGLVCDIMLWVLDVLNVVDVLVVEDMCNLCYLLDIYGILLCGCWLIVYYDYNVDCVRFVIFVVLYQGLLVVYVLDVGMLLVVDLGYWLVCDVIGEGLVVWVLLGFFVVLVGLLVLGLFSDCFLFVGFLFNVVGVCKCWIVSWIEVEVIVIVFESLRCVR